MSDVFISYSDADRAQAEILAQSFVEEGYSIFWDDLVSIRELFPDVVERALEKAKSVVVLWSRSSVKSSCVKEEARIANEKRMLFSVLIDSTEIPSDLRSIQTIQLIDWQGDKSHPEYQRLSRDLDRVISQRKS